MSDMQTGEKKRLLNESLDGTFLAYTIAGVEPTDASYARQAASFDPAVDPGVKISSADVNFPDATEDQGIVDGLEVWTEVSGGIKRWASALYGRVVTRGGATSQFDITVDGHAVIYTWDGTGTDPALTALDPLPGALVHIDAQNFTAANNGYFKVLDSGTNWFSVYNPDGVAEGNKTIGTGSIETQAVRTKTVEEEGFLTVRAGRAVFFMQ